MFSEAKSAYGLFFLTGAEVGEGAGTAGRGIAGRGKRPEADPKPDFRWIQNRKKRGRKPRTLFPGKTERRSSPDPAFQSQSRFFS
jgi:hypothetical protein